MAFALLGSAGLISAAAAQVTPFDVRRHDGTCDASAGVSIGPTLMLVANDEDNGLGIYQRGVDGPAIAKCDLSKFLGTKKETDLEGGAWLENRVYWIASHNKGHHERRHCLFATKVDVTGGNFRIEPVGEPYDRLLDDMLADDRLDALELEKASNIEPKKEGGLNIEGLSVTNDGKLMVGFRAPIPGGKALLLVIKNPKQVIKGKQAEFRKPILLDLDGLGIRSIEYLPGKDEYLIVAGRFDTERDSRLYRWTGDSDDDPELICKIDSAWNPEGLLFYTGQPEDRVQILSDDGADMDEGEACKDKPVSERRFRSGWLMLTD